MSNSLSSHSFITSQKGKQLLVIEDYVYQRTKTTENVIYWMCQYKDCPCRAHTNVKNEELIKHEGTHCHLPLPEKIEVRKMWNTAKERVKVEKMTSSGQIYEDQMARSNLSKTALAIAATSSQARKKRQRAFLSFSMNSFLGSALNTIRRIEMPAIPTEVIFNIPSLYTKTTDGERFLLADRQGRHQSVTTRIVLFATDEQLRFLFRSSHILMDGTFTSTPKHFEQVFSIHGLKHDECTSLSSRSTC
jgi:FLYWCH zinc finger domain